MTHADNASFFKSHDGLNLYYRDFGSDNAGTPVICLPGLTRNSRDFEDLVLLTRPDGTHLRLGEVATVVDQGSALELRPGFGPGIVTMLARVEGHPVGVVANNPTHLAGAIDREADGPTRNVTVRSTSSDGSSTTQSLQASQ